MDCLDCNGSGLYVGLGLYPAETCKTCGGMGKAQGYIDLGSGEVQNSGKVKSTLLSDENLVVEFGIKEWKNIQDCLYSPVRFKFDELLGDLHSGQPGYVITESPFIFVKHSYDSYKGYIGWGGCGDADMTINFAKQRKDKYIALYQRIQNRDSYKLIWDGRN